MTYYSSYDSPPPSSPASPSSAYIDSSPPSSPASNYFELDGFSCANDPYAGSAKATKSPRLYEKKRSRPLSPSPSPPDTKKPRISAQVEEIEREQVASTRSEGEIWSDAVARAIDEGHGHVDLENRSLTCVPSQAMLELNMLYVPSGAQELQMEKSYGRSKSFNRAKSVATEHWGFPRENLQLMLGWNSLTCLPQELFNLRKLTVLSLRFNNLSVLPPEIGQLSSLKVLNLSNNKLLFLPSELMQMNLEQLQIFPNPFLPLPRDTLSRARSFVRFKSRLRTQSEDHKPYSSIIPIFPGSVIPLFELSLRRLLSPISNLSDQSLLEEIYELPLSEGNDANGRRGTKRAFQQTLPPLVRDVLDVTNYGSVYVESTESPPGNSQSSSSLATGSQTFVEFEAYLKERLHSLTSYDAEYQRVTGKGICSSPRHGGHKFMFVVPAEECFTWEHTVAAVPNLGQVPIRWRGCQKGCLNFLSSQSREEPGPLVVAPATNGDEVDCVEDDIVQHVQLSSGFAFDGFGD
ncbi:hypothetical protein E1B28_004543 [Marasmius oreades]|uniref:Uncharacterized protein n=1 Tax=Marasmius oreades TaxID=181124 RepID=A0A9P8AD32_9AGAR|nr:uncharacterized protein E1B28_004543 [Marasmius oreades]KAG7097167.1 hypothetical protein E1B28_004543 [Marasmius oreades]